MPATYRLLARLEPGELADLFRAERDGRADVVVKLFHQTTSDRAYARTLYDNADAMRAVAHPGVAHWVDIGFISDRLATVRLDVGGLSLGQVLSRLNTKDAVVSVPLILSWLITLGEILDAAHRVGVAHGALTPGNVLVPEASGVAIADFGALAALRASPALSKAFARAGRSAYRAPEVTKGDIPTPESDAFSLGVIAYELLTLRLPSAADATISVRHERTLPPSRIDRRINSRLDAIVLRAIEVTPQRRYKSCLEFSAALRDVLAHSGGTPAPDEQRKALKALFPNEVQLATSTAVPFGEAFKLTDVTGATPLLARERSELISVRPLFSGGEVDPTAETLEMTPAQPIMPEEVLAESPTTAERWAAPVAAVAQSAAMTNEAMSTGAMKRVKAVEDFSESVGLAVTAGLSRAPIPGPKEQRSNPRPPARPAPGAADTQATDVPIPEEPPDIPTFHNPTPGRVQWWAITTGLVLLAVAGLIVATKWASSELPPAAEYRPAPITSRPRPAPKPAPPPRPAPAAPAEDCYDPPDHGGGYLTVDTQRVVRVYVDNVRVCASAVRGLAVPPGKHRIRVADVRSGDEQLFDSWFESGRERKLIPLFSSKR